MVSLTRFRTVSAILVACSILATSTAHAQGDPISIVDGHQRGPVPRHGLGERRPARGDVSAQVLTSPAHIVALPKMAGSIRFEKSDT